MMTFHVPGERSIPLTELNACTDLTRRAVWIDLFQPTREEELTLESALALDVPTRDEMQEIELSRRLYREGETLFMTATVLTRSDTNHPESSAITFILLPDRLVTVRYAAPVAFQVVGSRWNASPSDYDTAPKILSALVDAMAERFADILENTAAGIDRLSLEVFSDGTASAPALPLQRDFKEILRRVGRYSDIASRARESLVSLGRLISFLREEQRDPPRMKETLAHLRTVGADLSSLGDHAGFLSGKLSFLLDATLGLINNEQNGIIKIVSVAALVFLPPTLVASIYGMNFEHMPELRWLLGYPLALLLMGGSAVLPYAYFKRKGWL